MEENLGNADVARMLYRYGIKVDPQSEAVWDAWIRLEEKEEKYERANELRNYSIQDRVQVVLPRDFSTLETNYNFVEEFFTKVHLNLNGLVDCGDFSFPTGYPREDQSQRSDAQRMTALCKN